MLQAASGFIDITPQHAIPLAGFADRSQPFDAITGKLEINLVVLKDENKYYLLFSVDTLFVPEDFVQVVIRCFGEQYGIKEEFVWMNATHTHFAPSLDDEKPLLGHCDSEYYVHVKAQLIQLTGDVLQRQAYPVRLEYRTGDIGLNVNRRKRLLRLKDGWPVIKTLMLPNYEGYRDTKVHSIRLVSTETNQIVAEIWSYACHPVQAFERNAVSADYIGLVRKWLREYHDNQLLSVVFMQGFAGNVKADVTPVTHTRRVDRLRYFFQIGPKYTRFPSKEDYCKWTRLLWHRYLDIACAEDCMYIEAEMGATIHKTLLSEIIGNNSDKEIIFKKLQFGHVLCIVNISAEVVSEFLPLLQAQHRDTNLICTAYGAGSRIYLPTDKMLDEGGYEVHGFKTLFGIDGEFKPSLNNKILEAVSKLRQ